MPYQIINQNDPFNEPYSQQVMVLKQFYDLAGERMEEQAKKVISAYMWIKVNERQIKESYNRYQQYLRENKDHTDAPNIGALGSGTGIPLHFENYTSADHCWETLQRMINNVEGTIDWGKGNDRLADLLGTLTVGCCIESHSRSQLYYVGSQLGQVPPIIADVFSRSIKEKTVDSIRELLKYIDSPVMEQLTDINVIHFPDEKENESKEVFSQTVKIGNAKSESLRIKTVLFTFEHLKKGLLESFIDEKEREGAQNLIKTFENTAQNLIQFRRNYLSAVRKGLDVNRLSKCVADLNITIDNIKGIIPYLTVEEIEQTALGFAAIKRWDMLLALVNISPPNIRFSYQDAVSNLTVLHCVINAAIEGNTHLAELISTLVPNKANIYVVNNDGYSPLSLALWANRDDLMKLLLADSAAEKRGLFLEELIESRQWNLVDRLLDKKDPICVSRDKILNLFDNLIANKEINLAMKCVEKLNTPTGRTACLMSLGKSNLILLGLNIIGKVDETLIDAEGDNILHIICSVTRGDHKHISAQLLGHLLSAGADINLYGLNKQNKTPLELALSVDNIEAVNILIQYTRQKSELRHALLCLHQPLYRNFIQFFMMVFAPISQTYSLLNNQPILNINTQDLMEEYPLFAKHNCWGGMHALLNLILTRLSPDQQKQLVLSDESELEIIQKLQEFKKVELINLHWQWRKPPSPEKLIQEMLEEKSENAEKATKTFSRLVKLKYLDINKLLKDSGFINACIKPICELRRWDIIRFLLNLTDNNSYIFSHLLDNYISDDDYSYIENLIREFPNEFYECLSETLYDIIESRLGDIEYRKICALKDINFGFHEAYTKILIDFAWRKDGIDFPAVSYNTLIKLFDDDDGYVKAILECKLKIQFDNESQQIDFLQKILKKRDIDLLKPYLLMMKNPKLSALALKDVISEDNLLSALDLLENLEFDIKELSAPITEKNQTILHLTFSAIIQRRSGAIQLFIGLSKMGVDPLVRDSDNLSVFDKAIQANRLDIVKILLENTKNPNACLAALNHNNKTIQQEIVDSISSIGSEFAKQTLTYSSDEKASDTSSGKKRKIEESPSSALFVAANGKRIKLDKKEDASSPEKKKSPDKTTDKNHDKDAMVLDPIDKDITMSTGKR